MHYPLHYCDILLRYRCEIMEGYHFLTRTLRHVKKFRTAVINILLVYSELTQKWFATSVYWFNRLDSQDNFRLKYKNKHCFLCATALDSIEGSREWMVRGSGNDRPISYEYLSGGLEPNNREININNSSAG